MPRESLSPRFRDALTEGLAQLHDDAEKWFKLAEAELRRRDA